LRDAAANTLLNTQRNAEEQFPDDDVWTDTLALPSGERKTATLNPSPAGSILVVTANVQQNFKALRLTGPGSCTAKKGVTMNEQWIFDHSACASNRRELSFAKRIRELGAKSIAPPSSLAGEPWDGMGQYVPDLIMLQEVRCADAVRIRNHLWAHIKVNTGANIPPRAMYQVFGCIDTNGNPELPVGTVQKDEVDVPISWMRDTVVLMLRDTMRPIEMAPGQRDTGRGVVAQYGPEAIPSGRCTKNSDGSLRPFVGFFDAGDGSNGCHIRYERAWIQGFEETVGDAKIATASVHNPSSPQLEGLAPEQRDPYVKHWSEKVADYLKRRYGSLVQHLTLTGDFNLKRCADPATGQPQEPVTCQQRQWWTAMTTSDPAKNNRIYQFGDAVYDRVVAEGRASVDPYQYWDGCETFDNGQCLTDRQRDKRIDYIFDRAAGSVPATPYMASHDLTCGVVVKGFDTAKRNCDELKNPERYSNHRLVWAFVGGGPAPAP
jgi:hypothetical protein